MQLTGGGFKQLRPWSAAALREVRAVRSACGQGSLSLEEDGPGLPAPCCNLPLAMPLCHAGGAGGARHGGHLGARGQHV